MRIYFPTFAVLTMVLVSGCSVNINTPQPTDMSSEQQDFLACEMWFEELPPGGIFHPDVKDLTPFYDALDKRIEKLSQFQGLLPLQIKRVQEQIIEETKFWEETGEMPYSSTSVSSLIATCEEILNGG